MTFDIDANGIINVTAKDKATNNEQKVTITSCSGLSKEEIDKMARDAESHASEDQKRKDEIDARNKADSTVYQVEKLLKEHRDKISDADAKAVEEALENTRKKIAEGSVGRDQQGGGCADPGQPQAGGGDVQVGQRGSGSAGPRGRRPGRAQGETAPSRRKKSRRTTWSTPSSSTSTTRSKRTC